MKLILASLFELMFLYIQNSTAAGSVTINKSQFIKAEMIPNEYKVEIRFNPHIRSTNRFQVNSLIRCVNAMIIACMDQCNAISYVDNACQFGTIALNGSLISTHVSKDFGELFIRS